MAVIRGVGRRFRLVFLGLPGSFGGTRVTSRVKISLFHLPMVSPDDGESQKGSFRQLICSPESALRFKDRFKLSISAFSVTGYRSGLNKRLKTANHCAFAALAHSTPPSPYHTIPHQYPLSPSATISLPVKLRLLINDSHLRLHSQIDFFHSPTNLFQYTMPT